MDKIKAIISKKYVPISNDPNKWSDLLKQQIQENNRRAVDAKKRQKADWKRQAEQVKKLKEMGVLK